MSAEIHNCIQGSPEWFELRRGLPTASEFKSILAKGEGKTRRTYMHKLAGEIITGESMEKFTNAHLERGHAMEPEARELYSFLKDCAPTTVGFIKNGRAGCSPDSLIGADGALEIKNAMPHILIGHIEKNEFPSEHAAQCQGILWVAELEWIDCLIYWPKMPPLIKRAYRDDKYIKNLSTEVALFNEELSSLVDRILRFGKPQETKAA
jgi:hypothetical protein